MADDEIQQESHWLIEPPGPNEVHLSISMGDDVPIAQDIRQAIDRILGSFQTQEVEGFAACFPKCLDLSACGMFSCSLNNCRDLYRYPCAVKQTCRIGLY